VTDEPETQSVDKQTSDPEAHAEAVRREVSQGDDTETIKKKHGFYIIVVGVIVTFAIYLVAAYKWADATDVASATTSVAGVVGTFVGFFFGAVFGYRTGEPGRRRLEKERIEAERRAFVLALGSSPEAAARYERLVGDGN
jgi:hypothetical protein